MPACQQTSIRALVSFRGHKDTRSKACSIASSAITFKRLSRRRRRWRRKTERSGNGGRRPSGDFQDFISKRKEVDEAIEKVPTLLKRKEVLTAYEKYLRKTFEVRAKWKKKKAKDEASQRINDRMQDIEVYEETSKLVGELHRKIF